jgi:hypothetical protein
MAAFTVGHTVGEIARRLYDPAGTGVLIDAQRDGFSAALAQTQELLGSAQPVFEAAFSAGGALALADVMLPISKGGRQWWQMVEVKSSTGVKDYHWDDTAIQAFIARAAGVPLQSIALAHIDSSWVYPGSNDYRGLLTQVDVTAEAFGRENEVKDWIGDAQLILGRAEPEISTGDHCGKPFECPFIGHCSSQEQQAEYPVQWLPRIATKKLKAHIAEHTVSDLREVPDDLLNERQRRVKSQTMSGTVYFDRAGAGEALRTHALPAYFLDFETIRFAVPIWSGTRPYQQIPFQFSLHRLSRNGVLEAVSFLDLSGADPARAFAERLVSECGERGPIFVYNAAFEATRIKELAARFPHLKNILLALNERIVDLRPIAEAFYYHPDQQGSWSLKNVLPAMAAYVEAIHPDTTAERKIAIEQELREYCGLDTFALVRLWQLFTGHVH